MKNCDMRFYRSDRENTARCSVWASESCMLLGITWHYERLWTISNLYEPYIALGKSRIDTCFALGQEHRLCPGCDVIGGIELFWNEAIKHERAN